MPIVFIRWINVVEIKDSSGNYISNHKIFNAAINNKLNIVDCCVMIGCMTELNSVFNNKEVLGKK